MSLYGALAETVREGKEIITGRGTFGAGGTVNVAHPFAEVIAVLTSLEHADSTGPVAPTVFTITHRVDGAVVEFAAWASDAASDTDPLELVADTSESSFTYAIIGRRRR